MLIRLNVFGERLHILFFGGKAGVRDARFAFYLHFARAQIVAPLIVRANRAAPNDFIARPNGRAMMRVGRDAVKVNGCGVAHFR